MTSDKAESREQRAESKEKRHCSFRNVDKMIKIAEDITNGIIPMDIYETEGCFPIPLLKSLDVVLANDNENTYNLQNTYSGENTYFKFAKEGRKNHVITRRTICSKMAHPIRSPDKNTNNPLA